jgi:hypothetical protein
MLGATAAMRMYTPQCIQRQWSLGWCCVGLRRSKSDALGSMTPRRRINREMLVWRTRPSLCSSNQSIMRLASVLFAGGLAAAVFVARLLNGAATPPPIGSLSYHAIHTLTHTQLRSSLSPLLFYHLSLSLASPLGRQTTRRLLASVCVEF